MNGMMLGRIGQTCECTPSVSAHAASSRAGLRRSIRSRTLAPDRSQAAVSKDLEQAQKSLSRQFQASYPSTSSDVADRFDQLAGWSRRALTARQALLSSTEIQDDDYHPSQGWKTQPHHPSKAQLWEQIRREAHGDASEEPALASFLYSTVLSHSSLEKTIAFLLANKLANSTILGSVQLMGLFQSAYDDDPDIMEAAVADLLAVKDRDPACEKYTQCLLYFKGFQAIQCHRVAHWLWNQGRKGLAMALQSRLSEIFHVDIHPAAMIGRGVLLDHATGVVIGQTAVVGDNVSMLHHVTLGGSGTGSGVRHPTIGHGVLLGAGVSVLGPVVVGAGSKVGAGSVVVSELPAHSVAVGVPAKVIKRDLIKEPVRDMDQCYDFIIDYVI